MNCTMPTDSQFTKYYRKHQKCLKLGGLQPKTIEAYSRAIRRIGNYFDCRIDNLSSDQLLDYFNELLDSHSWSAVKLDLYGLKFFYTKVLGKTWTDLPLVKPPKTKRIPDILSKEQLNQLFAATTIVSYKVFLVHPTLAYFCRKSLAYHRGYCQAGVGLKRFCALPCNPPF